MFSRARNRFLLFFLMALWLSACAGSPPPAGERPITPLVWRAVAPDGESSFYLLGSIHVGSGKPRKFAPGLLDAFARSEELVVEVDLSTLDPTQMAHTFATKGALPEGTTLDEVVSEETWKLLVERLATYQIPPESLHHLEPWAVFLTLLPREFAAEGYTAEHGVDQGFIDQAKGLMPIVALESAEGQLAMMDGFPYDVQETMLLDFLAPEQPAYTSALVSAWERGDERELVALFFGTDDPERWAPVHEKLFWERNERMTAGLDGLARDGKTRFVVLGAAHMVGPRGIPALLTRRGFAVTRLGGR